MGIHSKKVEVLNKILTLCKESPKTTEELSSLLRMNYNTIRSRYVYHLYKKDKLGRKKREYFTK
jgi:hypothetical protein